LFSDKIKKVKMLGFTQERILVVTRERIYNIKKDKIKRIIQIKSLGGISKTVKPGKMEFTLHIPSEYDYRFSSEKYLNRKELNNYCIIGERK
jgi:hypothetical protein